MTMGIGSWARTALRRSPVAIIAMFAVLIAGLYLLFGGPREPKAVGGPQVMRRLTEAQYRASISDIFGPELPVVARFEKPVRSDGLIAIGTGEAGMSPFAVEQFDAAAQSIAKAVLSKTHRGKFLSCSPRSERVFDEQCARAFLSDVGFRLFRRPLTTDQLNLYVGGAREGQRKVGSFYNGLELALYAMLMSPDFLFRIERVDPESQGGIAELDGFSKASRLSFFLTNSTPDEELLEAAANGELDSWWGLRRQVDRLMALPRFEEATRDFFTDMLQFDRFDSLAKDPAIYPAFTTELAADAQEQTLRTIVHHLITEKGDYRDLFTTRETFLTRPLGVVYQTPVATRNGWEQTVFDKNSGRGGIHTHASFLALHAHPGRSSPTLRGYAVRDIFLCQNVPDPPPDVNFAAVEAAAHKEKSTARDRLVLHMTEPACAGCHKVMDPLGLTLENFDGLGTWRTYENGARINTAGSLDGPEFNSPAGLAKALRDHPETPRCLAAKLYKSAVGRDITWDERPYLDWLIASFKNSGYRFPDLMRAIALSDNFFAIVQPTGKFVTKPEPNPANGERS